jgi:hypothetical protein
MSCESVVDCKEYKQCIHEAYTSVKTWSDLIRTNVAFLEGKQKATFYSSSEFHDNFYMENVWRIENDLIRLNKNYNLFTHDYQSSMISYDSVIQRGYIAFVCQKNQAFIKHLIDDDRIYTFVREENTDGTSSILHNCPKEIALTEPYGVKFKIAFYDNETNEIIDLVNKFPDITSLFEDAIHVFVMLREFPINNIKSIQPTKCILDALEK